MKFGISFLLRLRTKCRANLETLITKYKMETTYLASLMIKGIVISLEIIAIWIGDRGSKSVIYVFHKLLL